MRIECEYKFERSSNFVFKGAKPAAQTKKPQTKKPQSTEPQTKGNPKPRALQTEGVPNQGGPQTQGTPSPKAENLIQAICLNQICARFGFGIPELFTRTDPKPRGTPNQGDPKPGGDPKPSEPLTPDPQFRGSGVKGSKWLSALMSCLISIWEIGPAGGGPFWGQK